MTEQENAAPSRSNRGVRRLITAGAALLFLAFVFVRASGPNPTRSNQEFDDGSRIEARAPSPLQVENLALLGKVWGFAKYHHPRVTAGAAHWDYELFRIMPRILDARSMAEATEHLVDWLHELGDLPGCSDCATLPPALHLTPAIDWIHDESMLGPELSELLELIHENKAMPP